MENESTLGRSTGPGLVRLGGVAILVALAIHIVLNMDLMLRGDG